MSRGKFQSEEHRSSTASVPETDTAPEPTTADETLTEPVPVPMESPPRLPVVYQFSDEELLKSSPKVPPEVLDTIRATFEQEAGVAELDRNDPEYWRRWKLAEPSAEDRYRTLFGWQAYGELIRRAAIEAAQADSTPAP